MGVTEDLADQLAQDALKAEEVTGDERIVDDLATMMGATSQTAEEAFLTAVRVRRANAKARKMLADRVKAFKAAQGGAPEAD
ncbi:hypothetical protein ACEWPL_002200 [Roseovarius sp. S1116L3]|uniref:hypothetical protein n=1 Tax=Roseovarius roseus TaxID=3342636 RepID=UPI00372AA4D0